MTSVSINLLKLFYELDDDEKDERRIGLGKMYPLISADISADMISPLISADIGDISVNKRKIFLDFSSYFT